MERPFSASCDVPFGPLRPLSFFSLLPTHESLSARMFYFFIWYACNGPRPKRLVPSSDWGLRSAFEAFGYRLSAKRTETISRFQAGWKPCCMQQLLRAPRPAPMPTSTKLQTQEIGRCVQRLSLSSHLYIYPDMHWWKRGFMTAFRAYKMSTISRLEASLACGMNCPFVVRSNADSGFAPRCVFWI